MMFQLFKKNFSLSTEALSRMRIFLGITLLFSAWSRYSRIEWFYHDGSIFPRLLNYSAEKDFFPALCHLSGSDVWQQMLLGLLVLSALIIILGFQSRVGIITAWIILYSFDARTPFVVEDVDQFLRSILFWCMFLPLDRHFGLDSNGEEERFYFSWGGLGLILQLSLVLIASALQTIDPAWVDGSILMKPFQFFLANRPIGQYLDEYPQILKLITGPAKWVQMGAGFLLLFRKMRPYGAAIAILLHVMYLLTVGMVFYSAVSIVVLISMTGQARDLIYFEWKEGFGNALRVATESLAILSLVYVLTSNILSLPLVNTKMPAIFAWYGKALGLNQKWSMFGYQLDRPGWYYFQGVYVSRVERGINGHQDRQNLLPQDLYSEYKKPETFIFFLRLHKKGNDEIQQSFANYLCRKVGRKSETPLREVNIYYSDEDTLEDLKKGLIEPMATASCLGSVGY